MWSKKIKADPDFKNFKFKKLDKGYPEFQYDPQLVRIVNLEEFCRIEPNCLPLFIGTQFGIYPNINKMDSFFNGEKKLAILSKSLLSGTIGRLVIYQINAEDRVFRFNVIATF